MDFPRGIFGFRVGLGVYFRGFDDWKGVFLRTPSANYIYIYIYMLRPAQENLKPSSQKSESETPNPKPFQR